jgi:UDP-glucose 4-epimerase
MTDHDLAGKRVLVTGGSGFVGRHLVERLTAAGAEVWATSRRPGSRPGATQWTSLDLGDPQSVHSAVRRARPEVVFHLAARLGSERAVSFAEVALRENVLGTHALLAALVESAVPVRLVAAGSAEEYGRAEAYPITEDQPLRPVSPYSLSKAAASMLALTYGSLYGLAAVVVRPFIVYGPGQSPGMLLPSLVETLLDEREFAMTAGEQTRDFVYVDDAVEGMIAAAMAEGAPGEAINLCSAKERSIREVAELAAELMGSRAPLRLGALPYRANEVWRLFGSNDKARRLLGWTPRTPLDEGLRKTIAWYSQQRAGRS